MEVGRAAGPRRLIRPSRQSMASSVSQLQISRRVRRPATIDRCSPWRSRCCSRFEVVAAAPSREPTFLRGRARSRRAARIASSMTSVEGTGLAMEADRARDRGAVARVVGRDDADRDVARRQVGLQAVQDAPARHVGQEDVERDRASGLYSLAEASSPSAPSRGDEGLEAARRARPRAAKLREREVVLDDQQHAVAGLDGRRGRRRPRWARQRRRVVYQL